ncbi:hypothetical protein GCM10020331_055070 [Ectobacillus funiculus]
MSWITFAIASTIGKVPALLIEVYSVNKVMNGSLVGKSHISGSGSGDFSYTFETYISKKS